jgi:tetratricopeptide (TPR) repeat protein
MHFNKEILIDFLDHQLDQEDTDLVEKMIQDDKAVADELLYLKLAVDTVRMNSINNKVLEIRNSLSNIRGKTNEPADTIIHSLYKISIRVAAVFILLFGAAILFKYISVNNLSVYQKQFAGYELMNTRGPESREPETEAYRSKNWNEVLADFQKENNKSNKATFLAAMAYMELKNYPQAVSLFENILYPKFENADSSFREETEYNLSLAYLMNHQENKGIALLNKIKADTSHIYYPLASKLSTIDLKIIELKNK